MSDIARLVARLKRANGARSGDPILMQAANALERQAALIEEQREALRPFAKQADEIERVAKQQGWEPDSIRRSVRYVDACAARATLGLASPDKKEG